MNSRKLLAPDSPDAEDKKAAEPFRRLPRFYGRRKGKPLRQLKRELIQTLLPALAIPTPAEGLTLDPRTLFPVPPKEVWLEVGFGAGEHTAAQALAHLDVGLIASEVFLNGLGGLLKHIAAQSLSNIRIYPEDARKLLPALPDNCLAKVFVLFPDPWPKKRHAERRFIGPANLDQISRLLKPGGELRVASDHLVYIDWTLEQMALRPDFVPTIRTGDRPSDWPPSRYEQKAAEKGIARAYMAWVKR
ncbi:MAG: tRNA (guanine(46)-N(7))-methyltransferase TrmB [Rhodospirillales bacterium]|nr:tRNA (guanine(46)-N(7))-methyltransferase TrmB [Rhodospirillales bacterium]